MEVVHFLVTPYCVHIGVYTLADMEAVLLEREALPFCKRVNHLGSASRFLNFKGNGSFIAVEVVVQTPAVIDKEGSGRSFEVERLAEIYFKASFYKTDGGLSLICCEIA